MCLKVICNKIPYPSKKEALKDAKRIKADTRHFRNKSLKKDNKKFRAYCCPRCQLWHLTSRRQK